jgi:hypothetical protein
MIQVGSITGLKGDTVVPLVAVQEGTRGRWICDQERRSKAKADKAGELSAQRNPKTFKFGFCQTSEKLCVAANVRLADSG